MSFANKIMPIVLTGLLLSASATAVFAQTGGGDVPTDAKKQGTKENGPSSTGMSQGEADKGSMKKDDSGSMPKKSGDKM